MGITIPALQMRHTSQRSTTNFQHGRDSKWWVRGQIQACRNPRPRLSTHVHMSAARLSGEQLLHTAPTMHLLNSSWDTVILCFPSLLSQRSWEYLFYMVCSILSLSVLQKNKFVVRKAKSNIQLSQWFACGMKYSLCQTSPNLLSWSHLWRN